MKRTGRDKINFILNYHEDFDRVYLLEDCLDLLTDEQLDELAKTYEDEYKEAWEYYKDGCEDGNYDDDDEEPDD